MDYLIRRARTPDVRVIGDLVNINVESRRLLGKATVTLYEDVQEFWVAERAVDGEVLGCGALHVMWEDLAEIRTVAVRPEIGRASCREGVEIPAGAVAVEEKRTRGGVLAVQDKH